MALSLDDRLLGEKMHYYCSSSEDEGEDEDAHSGDESEDGSNRGSQSAPDIPEPEIRDYKGRCTNTGPKGVINDWRRYKQMEVERKEAEELERLQLLKKLSLTCRSHLDDEKEKEKDDDFMATIEDFEDEFLKEYRQRRIEEMRRAFDNVPQFGKVVNLRGDQFIDAIDQEKPGVTIIVHVYADDVQACEAMTGCMICLAREYPGVKFCKLRATDAKLSLSFAEKGVPALLIYKAGEMIGNFIRLSDELGNDFYANDVEAYLLEHGMLPDKTLKVNIAAPKQEDSDSDFDID